MMGSVNCTYLHRVGLGVVIITVVELGEKVFTHLGGAREQQVWSEHLLSTDIWFVCTGDRYEHIDTLNNQPSNVLHHNLAFIIFQHLSFVLRHGGLSE